MGDRQVTQKKANKLLEHASYIQKEAEALKYVIEDVPYDTEFPDSRSIADFLRLMDHAQYNYYHPIITEVIKSKRPIHLEDFENYKDTFTSTDSDQSNIQNILDNLAAHRASLVSELKDISLLAWEKVCYKNNTEILLADIVKKMNRDDQIHLKKITNLIKSYHQQKQTQREVKQRQERQNFGSKEK